MKKGILLTIMLIIAAALTAFIAIMQHDFKNPDFSSQELASVSANNANSKAGEDPSAEEVDDEDNPTPLDGEEEKSEETEEEVEIRTYESTINVDLLNVREGPGTDHPIAGNLTLGQTVNVEDDGSEWVEIEAGEIIGYINRKYIDEVEQ